MWETVDRYLVYAPGFWHLPIKGTVDDVVGMLSLTISSKMDIANNVVIPKLIFSLRSPLVDAGMKNPRLLITDMIRVGMI